MSNLATSADCFDYSYRRSGEKDSSSRWAPQFETYLNIAHRELVAGNSLLQPQLVATFPWAKSATTKTIQLKAVVSGTAAVTNSSTSVTLSSAPSISLENYYVVFGTTDSTEYKISTHTALSTSVTLDLNYLGSTNAAIAFTAYKVDYTIGSGDILRLVSPLGIFVQNENGATNYQINGEEEFSFRRSFPLITAGNPTHFTVLNESSGTLTVKFNKYPSADRRVNIPYIPIPEDLFDSSSSVPLVPIQHRHTLCHLAIYFLMKDKDDERADENFQLAQVGYSAMLKDVGYRDVTFNPLKPNREVTAGA